ncbi:MAG: hypothetical protein ABI643_04225 [Candidatus Doudnabacteria bacterium]
MKGIEKSHCNAVIQAILSAFWSLMGSSAQEALRQVLTYGKGDTLSLDAGPEINIVRHLQRYDDHSVVITEETGQANGYFFESDDRSKYRTIFFCDPTDRSRQLKEALDSVDDKTSKVGDIFRKPEFQKDWEKRFGGIAAISGASSAVTCIRRGVPVFSVIANYITHQMFLSCSAGNYVVKIPDKQVRARPINVDFITTHADRVYFHDLDHADARLFVTFMGKSGYRENMVDSKLMDGSEIDQSLFYDIPGGPLRILYLSTLQPADKEIGFILANGEKIGEWIHWLPFVRFARKKHDDSEPALRLFEVYQDRPHTKEGILMSTPPAYSVFKPFNKHDERMRIDVSRFADFPNPSRIRATLIVTPYDNDRVTSVVRQYGYRAIELYSE